MFLLDLSGRIVSWNPGVERILGYSESEFVGQHTSVIFTPEDIEQGAHEQEMITARAQRSALDERWHVCIDGSLFWASGFLTFLQDEAGQPRGYAKILRDRTTGK
jgi:PAS domain S-box-containing protein